MDLHTIGEHGGRVARARFCCFCCCCCCCRCCCFGWCRGRCVFEAGWPDIVRDWESSYIRAKRVATRTGGISISMGMLFAKSLQAGNHLAQQWAVVRVGATAEILYAVQPLGQTAGLKWKWLSAGPVSHPDGWQAENRLSPWSDTRIGRVVVS
jgi:hypothetical protein